MKFKQIALVILLLVFFTQMGAQPVKVNGVVFDYVENKPIEFASIRVMSSDSLTIGGTSTTELGLFDLKLDLGNYILETSFVGYDTNEIYLNLTENSLELTLDTIFLFEKSIELEGISVTGKLPAIVVKGDTIEYSVNSYQSDENDVLQDIVRKLPGINIDAEGNLTANGKSIDKILIDGKEFFGNDIQRALRDLPAQMIHKIQLFKKETKEAEHTGFKSEEGQEQVLNLEVKDEAKKSIFGDVEAGYGTEDKYNISSSIYRMRDDKQLMGKAFVSNLDKQYGPNAFGNSGVEENKEASLSYNIDKKDKLELTTGLNYNDNLNKYRSETEIQQFLSERDRFSKEQSSSKNQTKGISGNFELRWRPDTLTLISFLGNLRHSKNITSTFSSRKSYVTDTTYLERNYNTEGITDNGDASLLVSRELGKKGRRVLLRLSGGLRDSNEDGYNRATTEYSLPTIPDEDLDQQSISRNKMSSWGVGLVYLEPLGKDNLLRASYSLNGNNSTRDKEVLRKGLDGEYSIVDTAYTRFSKNSYLNHRIGVSFQSKKEKYYYSLGLDILPQNMKTSIAFKDSVIEDLKQEVINYSPSLLFTWNPNKTKSFNINYYGRTEQPSLGQLSTDTTIISPINKQYGNSNLRTGYQNNLSLYYNSSNTEKEEFFSIYSNFHYSLNSIVNYSIMDSLDRTESTYRNVDGNLGANLGINYSRLIKKIRASAYGGVNYSKNKGFVNTLPSTTNSYSFTANLNLSYSHEKINVFLQGNISSNFTSSNLSTSQNLDMTRFGIANRVTWRLSLDFTFDSEITFSHSSKISDDIPQTNTHWNLTLSKTILKNKKGQLKFYVNNLLNEKNDIQRVVTDSQLSYTRSHSIGRYLLLSFIYRFNVMGK